MYVIKSPVLIPLIVAYCLGEFISLQWCSLSKNWKTIIPRIKQIIVNIEFMFQGEMRKLQIEYKLSFPWWKQTEQSCFIYFCGTVRGEVSCRMKSWHSKRQWKVPAPWGRPGIKSWLGHLVTVRVAVQVKYSNVAKVHFYSSIRVIKVLFFSSFANSVFAAQD